MSIIDRYAGAIKTSNLKSEPRTTYSDTDVIGAFGFAAKKNALGVSLARLLCGDGRASREVIEQLASMAREKHHYLRPTQAQDIAKAVLAWNSHGVCKECDGHGYHIIPGAPSLSDTECKACKGTGRMLLHKQFSKEHQEAALWVQSIIESVQATAGQIAMKSIAPSMVL